MYFFHQIYSVYSFRFWIHISSSGSKCTYTIIQIHKMLLSPPEIICLFVRNSIINVVLLYTALFIDRQKYYLCQYDTEKCEQCCKYSCKSHISHSILVVCDKWYYTVDSYFFFFFFAKFPIGVQLSIFPVYFGVL